MQYYSAVNKQQNQKIQGNGGNQKNYMELTQGQKDNHLMFSLTC